MNDLTIHRVTSVDVEVSIYDTFVSTRLIVHTTNSDASDDQIADMQISFFGADGKQVIVGEPKVVSDNRSGAA